MVPPSQTASQERLESTDKWDNSMISPSPMSDTNGNRAFRFFDLPFELRFKILKLVLVTEGVYCLDPQNFLAGSKRLNIFLTSRRMHEDAYRAFYGGHTFRIFPTHGRFFGTKTLPLIARLSTRYREALVSLELRLGIGWTAPPKSWTVNGQLGLEQMTRVRVLRILVECDPSLEVFRGFRVSRTFYTGFCQQLLEEILWRLPAVSTVEIETWPSVPSGGHLITTLMKVVGEAGMTVLLANGVDCVPKQKGECKAPSKALPYADSGITVT